MKQAIQLGVMSIANMALAFAHQWYTLTQIGPGIETDSLFAGLTIPQLILTVINGSLMHVLVPLFTSKNEKDLQADSWAFMILIGSIFGFFTLVLYCTAPYWIPVSLPGFSEQSKILTIELTRIQLIGIFFSAINGVQWATYHARQRFFIAEFTPFLSSAFAFILLVITLPHYGVIAAAWIYSIRMLLQTLLLAPGMGKPVLSKLNKPSLTIAWKRIQPLLLGATYYKTEPVIDRYLLSSASSGHLSLYYFALQIYSAFNQVINKAISAPLVTVLSKFHQHSEYKKFNHRYKKSLLVVGFLCMIEVIFFSLSGKLFLQLTLGQGNVSTDSINECWTIMMWLSGVFIGGALGQIASSAYYASGNTRTPVIVSTLTYTIYIPLKVFVYNSYGIIGLATLMSSYYIADFFLLYIFRNKS